MPFIDLPAFLNHIPEYGFPIIQDRDVLVPNGTSLDTFVVLPERDASKLESMGSQEEGVDQIMDAFKIGRYVFETFGITLDVLKNPSDLIVRYLHRTWIAGDCNCCRKSSSIPCFDRDLVRHSSSRIQILHNRYGYPCQSTLTFFETGELFGFTVIAQTASYMSLKCRFVLSR